MKSDIIDITVKRLAETEKAIRVTQDEPEDGVWLPKSQIEIEPSSAAGIVTGEKITKGICAALRARKCIEADPAIEAAA